MVADNSAVHGEIKALFISHLPGTYVLTWDYERWYHHKMPLRSLQVSLDLVESFVVDLTLSPASRSHDYRVAGPAALDFRS